VPVASGAWLTCVESKVVGASEVPIRSVDAKLCSDELVDVYNALEFVNPVAMLEELALNVGTPVVMPVVLADGVVNDNWNPGVS
jgi:hypothetical protein